MSSFCINHLKTQKFNCENSANLVHNTTVHLVSTAVSPDHDQWWPVVSSVACEGWEVWSAPSLSVGRNQVTVHATSSWLLLPVTAVADVVVAAVASMHDVVVATAPKLYCNGCVLQDGHTWNVQMSPC